MLQQKKHHVNFRVLIHVILFLTVLGALCVPNTVIIAGEYLPDMETHLRVIFTAKNEADISSEVNGKISKVHLLAGDSFSKGQLILELDKSVYQPALNQARTNLKLAEANFDRVKKIVSGKLQIIEAQAAVKAAEENLNFLELVHKDKTKVSKAEAVFDAAQKELDSLIAMQKSNEASVSQVANARRDFIVAESNLKMAVSSENVELATANKDVANASYKLQDVISSQKTIMAQAENDLAKAQTAYAAAEREWKACEIVAPYDGRLSAVRVNEHETVSFGQPLIRIVEDTVLYARFLVPGEYLTKIPPGTKISIFVPVTGQTILAEVKRTSAEVDPASNTLEITAELDNNDGVLRSGFTGWIDRNVIGAGSRKP